MIVYKAKEIMHKAAQDFAPFQSVKGFFSCMFFGEEFLRLCDTFHFNMQILWLLSDIELVYS